MSARDKNAVSPRLVKELSSLFYYHPPKELSRNLRKMFLSYVKYELETGSPDYFEDLVNELDWLFMFLDVAEEEFTEYDGNTDDEQSDEAMSFNNPDTVEDIIQRIVMMVQPEKIFSLNYTNPLATDDSTYYDLIIVLPATFQKPFSFYETLIEISCFMSTHIAFTLHQSSVLNKQISEGNLFYSLACTEENLMYSSTSEPMPIPSPEKIVEAKARSKKVFDNGYDKALSFLEGAKSYHDKGENTIAVFMLQQAAELTLRTVVQAFTGNDARTHSIVELQKNCRRIAPQLNQVFPGDTPKEERLLTVLEKAYLNARYKETFEVDPEDLVLLLQRVGILQLTALKIATKSF